MPNFPTFPVAMSTIAAPRALPGMTLLPGLIDMHVHLTSVAEIGGYQGLKYTDSFWQAVGVANAVKTLNAGFTTVRNVGSNDFDDVGLQQAIDGGWIQGPRIVPASYAIGATGGHCDDTGLPPYYDKKADSVISGPESAREKVRWLHKYGAKVIKICATGGVFSMGVSVGGQQLSLEEMKAIADEVGLDMVKLEKDLASAEVRNTLEENFKLAESMGMNGTPSYVIGKQVVIGAVGVDSLKEKIGIARCGKATC